MGTSKAAATVTYIDDFNNFIVFSEGANEEFPIPDSWWDEVLSATTLLAIAWRNSGE
jgi:hypothetical protein